MKKFLCILILTLGWLVSNGQLYPPIQPYQENDYSLSQVKRFAMGQNELSSSWRKEFLSIVNDALAKSGENMYLGEDKILSALDYVVYERRNLNYSFENSRNISNQVKFYSDFGFDGMVGVFKYGKCSVVIFKTRCMNLLKCSIDIITQVEIKQPEPRPEPTPDWRTYQAPRKMYRFNPPPMPVVIPVFKQRTWVGKHIVPIVIVFVITSGTIVVASNNHHHDVVVVVVVTPPPVVEPRTMPPGIPAVPVVPIPGVPSDPRGMPSGVGFVPHTNFGGGGITVFRF